MGKIIVVEDNLVYSRYVCNFLEENGYLRLHRCPETVFNAGR